MLVRSHDSKKTTREKLLNASHSREGRESAKRGRFLERGLQSELDAVVTERLQETGHTGMPAAQIETTFQNTMDKYADVGSGRRIYEMPSNPVQRGKPQAGHYVLRGGKWIRKAP